MDEQKHFDECLDVIRQNIDYYQKQVEKTRRETESLYAAVTSGSVELYDQLVVSLDIKEHQERQLKKNQTAYKKPYFGRVDYLETETGQCEQLYIGKNGISRDRTHVLIVDWRAPVSTLYYENELGPGCYQVPGSDSISVDLKLKRTFDIEDGALAGYYDNDTAATDELLVKYLSQNKDAVLGDIISTIQKEQDQIIRQTPFKNIIVQGVAGSGKTTVAMHRISYILYNYEQRFSPDQFCIIGNNDMLLNYITSGLPELDVYHVGQKRMDTFFQDLLGKDWKKSYQVKALSDSESFKSTLDFTAELDRYLACIRHELLGDREIKDPALGVILSADSISRTLLENQNASIASLCALLNQRIKSRIHFLMTDQDPDKAKAKIKEYGKYFQLEPARKNLVKLYQEFVENYGKCQGISVENLLAHVKKGVFDVCDLAALSLIQKRMTEKAFHDEYSQIIIDEAQDFGPAVYYVLRQVMTQCYFTIMGDVSQNIYYHTGLNDWNPLTEKIFEPERTSFHILSKSYRNTIEISLVAGKVLDAASFGRYKIQPVIRHGTPVSFYQVPPQNMVRKAAQLIAQIQSRGYDTIAVICRNQEDARQVQENLGLSSPNPDDAGKTIPGDTFTKGVMVLPVHLTKGLEFDCVILWNPDQKSYSLKEGEPNLLYVAITRALHELHILLGGEITELLSGLS